MSVENLRELRKAGLISMDKNGKQKFRKTRREPSPVSSNEGEEEGECTPKVQENSYEQQPEQIENACSNIITYELASEDKKASSSERVKESLEQSRTILRNAISIIESQCEEHEKYKELEDSHFEYGHLMDYIKMPESSDDPVSFKKYYQYLLIKVNSIRGIRKLYRVF